MQQIVILFCGQSCDQRDVHYPNSFSMAQLCTMMLEGQRTAAAINRQFKRAEEEKLFSTHAFSLYQNKLR